MCEGECLGGELNAGLYDWCGGMVGGGWPGWWDSGAIHDDLRREGGVRLVGRLGGGGWVGVACG